MEDKNLNTFKKKSDKHKKHFLKTNFYPGTLFFAMDNNKRMVVADHDIWFSLEKKNKGTK